MTQTPAGPTSPAAVAPETLSGASPPASAGSRLHRLTDALLAINRHRSLEGILQAVTDHARSIVNAADAGCTLGSDDPGPAPPTRADAIEAPLVARDGTKLGLLYVSGKSGGEFTETDRTMLSHLAQMGAVAVERARLQEELERRLEQLQGLAATAVAVNSPGTLDEMLRQLTGSAARLIGTHQAVTTLTVGDDWSQAINEVYLSDAYRRWQDYDAVPDGSGIYAIVCRENRAYRMTQAELEAHPAWRGFSGAAAEHPPLRGWLAAPLVSSDGQNLGLLQLSDKIDGSDFTVEDEAIAEQLAQMASVAVEKTRLFEAQARQESARFRDELLAGVSHDMQTPLAVIVGVAEALHDDPTLPVDERRTIYDTVARQARKLRSLVNQFLDFSRIEADRPLVLNVERCDVVETIDAIVPLYTHQREVIVGADEHLPLAMADRERLEQILLNLLSNAVKYSTGPVRVVARADADRVIVDVVDEGPGLEEEELQRVFGKFQRGDAAEGIRGTGLGLYISRALTDAMGGELTATSQPGLGCRFRVSLRRAPVGG